MQSDPTVGGKSVLDDDDRFCDLEPLALQDGKGAAVPLPDLSSGVSWETCVSSADAGFSRMNAAHLSNQVRFFLVVDSPVRNNAGNCSIQFQRSDRFVVYRLCWRHER